MRRIILETPYSGDVVENTKYAQKCMLDCLKRNEAPFASHLLYTQVLDDTALDQRHLGMDAGFEWGKVAEGVVVYTDRGISRGMELGIQKAKENKFPIEYRTL